MSKNFDLNEKINLIYDFNYNKDIPNCYKIDKVDIKNMPEIWLKKIANRKIYK